MVVNSIFKKRYHLEFDDVDFMKKLKLSTLFLFFQETANLHSEELGVGLDTLDKEYNVAWVLIRLRADIIRYPQWNDEIIMETWHQEPKKYEFERDFIVRDIHGNIIIRSISTWVIIDKTTRELKKSSLIPYKPSSIIERRAIECKLGRLKAVKEREVIYKRIVGYSDIDVNGHLNNSKYIDFIMDCFSFEDHKRYRVKSIQINYMNEALPDDAILICKDVSKFDENIMYMEGIREKNNDIVFRADIEIEKNI